MSTDTMITTAAPAGPRLSLKSLLDWIVARDAAYREARKLAEAAPERLRDMGIRPGAANAAFLQSYGANRWTPREW